LSIKNGQLSIRLQICKLFLDCTVFFYEVSSFI